MPEKADVLEGIMQLQGELDSESNSYLPTSATSLLENLYQLKPKSTPTAKSCPPEMANLNTVNVGHVEHFNRERIRKDNHNMIERRRRYNINDRIKELATLLPKSNDPHRQNKGTILKESVDYIRHMNKIKNNYESEVAERKRLESENKKLRLITQQLLMNQVPQIEEASDMNSMFDTSLLVKQEPIDSVVIDQDLSTSTFDDIMEDDQHFVIRNPMMGCPDNTTDDMDFNS